jgi:hypothetical protein
MANHDFDEIWVETSDGQALAALICDSLGWLTYLRWNGDAGFSSRNPDYNGPSDALTPYLLSNGQEDEYPTSWALPIEKVRQALDYFREHCQPPSFIMWHNDSGDGVELPFNRGA